MPDTFEIDDLEVPEDFQIMGILKRCVDIQPLVFYDEEYLVREGEESLEIYLILKGSFIVEHEKITGDKTRGEPLAIQYADIDTPLFIGEMAYIGNNLRTASVRCLGAVHTLRLKPEHLDIILDEFPFFARALSKQLTLRLKEADDLIKKYRADLEMDVSQVFKKEGEQLITQGEPADMLYQLVDGVLLKDTPSGTETITVTRTPADFINAREFFKDLPNSAGVRVKNTAILVGIAKPSKLAVIRNYPELLLALPVPSPVRDG